ncbi:MAG: DUF3410 domain-containing protein, partial [Bacteroidota bacterium]|nr:DUF3410 domain-containing protein [Bacteroidota bacterium]
PLRGASIGIIGVGHVGTWVQHFAERLGMRTVLNDPPLLEATGSAVFRPLEEALAADIVTLHVPLERGGPHPTAGMIGEEQFEMMRDGVVFINTSRGGVVDHGALTRAVRRGRTGAVVLDVWPDEPDVDPVLVACADIATPHIAGHSYDGKLLGSVMVFEAFCSWLGRETCLTYTDLLPNMRLEISIRPSGCTPLQCINGIISTAFDIDADDKMMRRMARLRDKKRRQAFASYRASYHPRREFPAWHVDRSALDAEVVRVIDALGFS